MTRILIWDVKYIKVIQLILKCFILFLLQIHTRTRAWCLCLCCHGDATCSLFHWSSSEKGENAILHPSFSSSRTADWGISGFFVLRLIFLSPSLSYLFIPGSSVDTYGFLPLLVLPRRKILGFPSYTFLTNCALPFLLWRCFTEAIGQ